MKNIYVLRDERQCWEDIEKCLKSVNARLVHIGSDFDRKMLVQAPPCLFIVAEGAGGDLLKYELRNYVLIVVKDGGPPGEIKQSLRNKKRVSIVWPLSPDAFLKLSAEMIRLAERRLFKAIVRIYPDDDEMSHMGQSVDFSLSGMAFTTQYTLTQGSRVEVSLSLPNSSRSVRVPLEIMRTSPGEYLTTYGARYASLDPSVTALLRDFVMEG